MQAAKKILVMGCENSGKSALITRFVHNRFSYSYSADTQIKVEKKTMRTKTGPLNLVIWIAPGYVQQVRAFKSCYLGTDALVHVIDINNPSTFYNLEEWLAHYKKHLPGTPVYLVCNKIDENIDLDCENYFDDVECNKMFFTSAKDNFKVSELFSTICTDVTNEKHHYRIKVY